VGLAEGAEFIGKRGYHLQELQQNGSVLITRRRKLASIASRTHSKGYLLAFCRIKHSPRVPEGIAGQQKSNRILKPIMDNFQPLVNLGIKLFFLSGNT
jgi:hypothetical protein